jgi:hypothetical protein
MGKALETAFLTADLPAIGKSIRNQPERVKFQEVMRLCCRGIPFGEAERSV